MKEYTTEQEDFWAGEFGDAYILRNQNEQILSAKIATFSKILNNKGKISSCLELGANIGLNLQALRLLIPDVQCSAVEINANAVAELEKAKNIEVFSQSILEFQSEKLWDLTFTSGVLIHLNPQILPRAYEILYKNSKKYSLILEYYNPVPVEVNYRGNDKKLFKRDFAGEFMDIYPDIHLLDYGFVYHRDNMFAGDDFTWFLMEKK